MEALFKLYEYHYKRIYILEIYTGTEPWSVRAIVCDLQIAPMQKKMGTDVEYLVDKLLDIEEQKIRGDFIRIKDVKKGRKVGYYYEKKNLEVP